MLPTFGVSGTAGSDSSSALWLPLSAYSAIPILSSSHDQKVKLPSATHKTRDRRSKFAHPTTPYPKTSHPCQDRFFPKNLLQLPHPLTCAILHTVPPAPTTDTSATTQLTIPDSIPAKSITISPSAPRKAEVSSHTIAEPTQL